MCQDDTDALAQGHSHPHAGILQKIKPWETQGTCHWIHIIIMNNNIYGLGVGIWIVSEIFGFWWNERGRVGHDPRGRKVCDIECIWS